MSNSRFVPSEDDLSYLFKYSSLLGNNFINGGYSGKNCSNRGLLTPSTGRTCGLGPPNRLSDIINSIALGDYLVSNYTTNKCAEAVPTSFVAVTQVSNI